MQPRRVPINSVSNGAAVTPAGDEESALSRWPAERNTYL